MFYTLYDFQDDANARPVYNRDKNNDQGLRTSDSHNQACTLLELSNYCTASHPQLTAGMLPKVQTRGAPAQSQNAPAHQEYGYRSTILTRSSVNLRRTEVWKPVSLLETESAAGLHWNPWDTSMPRSQEKKMTLSSLLLSTEKLSLRTCLTLHGQ